MVTRHCALQGTQFALVGGEPGMPQRVQHKGFGDLSAVWSTLTRLGVADAIDEAVGARRSDAAASVGTYLALAIANRVVAPCSKLGFADWWATTAGPRFTKIGTAACGHRNFWSAMDLLDAEALIAAERAIAARMVSQFDLDLSGLALDMVVLDTPSHPSKRAATCGNAASDRSVTFQVRERIARHRLIAAGSQKVCGQPSNIVTGASRAETDHFLPASPDRGCTPRTGSRVQGRAALACDAVGALDAVARERTIVRWG